MVVKSSRVKAIIQQIPGKVCTAFAFDLVSFKWQAGQWAGAGPLGTWLWDGYGAPICAYAETATLTHLKQNMARIYPLVARPAKGYTTGRQGHRRRLYLVL